MAVIIENLNLRKPLSLMLNSGKSLLLRPGGQSDKIHDLEIENNSKVQKLLTKQHIALHTIGKKAPTSEERKSEKAKPENAKSKKSK
jgi:hypothetical protein